MSQIILDSARIARLDKAARSMGMSREDLLNQAIDSFMDALAAKADYEKWFIEKVEKSIQAADRGELLPGAAVEARFERRLARLFSASDSK